MAAGGTFLAPLMALGILFTSCQAPQGTAGFIDPVFAYAVPSSARLFASAVRDVIILPETGTSAALYAGLEGLSPRVVLLSPLLATEIDSILSTDDSRIVAIFGESTEKAKPRVHAAGFSSIDAARQAGSTAAAETSAGKADAKVCGLFAGSSMEELRAAAAAFSEAYVASGGRGEPLLEMVEDGFSQALAQKIASFDVRIAYVSAPPDSAERWIREAFDPDAYVMAELPLPSEQHPTLADALVVWDIGSTLRMLLAGIENGNNEHVSGVWNIQSAESRNGKGKR